MDDPLSMFQKNGYVVGRYSPSGKPIEPGRSLADAKRVEEIVALQKQHAASAKGSPLTPADSDTVPIKAKKTRGKKKTKEPESEPPVAAVSKAPTISTEAEHPLQTIGLITAYGRLQYKVLGVLPGTTSVALVFKSDNDIHFEPEIGAKFDLIIDNVQVPVTYSGIKYLWLDLTKPILVFLRRNL